MDVTDRVYTAGMTDEEVDERLRERQTGVLSLARDGDAYAVPVAFRYDGESIRFRLGDDGASRKLAFADATDTACFLAYGYEGPEDSWSIIATGPIRRLPEEDRDATTAADLNDQYVPLRVFDEAIEETALIGYELEIEAITGRRTVR
ncbi:pyridoxamine 5'-phosphate oxidase family protein [Halobaculum roseum]|uniref:Pyridoxamine 5'-phosphate oxidase family protein n=1 Tax=Halobaculum roseum TaxID=2175149 RepID=A0ABD5MQI1_9EURY|nr:pyridoxamine 5'-phosphate oxidase family protein [Halobaculum roseum]QZY04498.1 pyridoxamine 5'-phosphate oxidase family protein [Halobaculum roseum]